MRKILALALLWSLDLPHLRGHSDPYGEIHPLVIPLKNGRFEICYLENRPPQKDPINQLNNYTQQKNWRSFTVSATEARGKSTYPVSDSSFKVIMQQSNLQIEKSPPYIERMSSMTFLCEMDEATSQVTKTKLPNHSISDQTLLIGEEKIAYVTSHWAQETPKSLSQNENIESRETECWLRIFSKESFHEILHINLGISADIMTLPIISNMVWSHGHYWVARMRKIKPTPQSQLLPELLSIEPHSKKVKHYPIQGTSRWNSSIALGISADGSVCVAWHSLATEDSTSHSKIHTQVISPR